MAKTTTNNASATITSTTLGIAIDTGYAFEAVLNEASVTDVLHTTMIETMFNQVVVNTVRTGAHVTEHRLNLMKEVFNEFLNATEIKFVKSNIDTGETINEETFVFTGINDSWEEDAIRLIVLLKKERMFFEITFKHEDGKRGVVCYDGSLEKELLIVR